MNDVIYTYLNVIVAPYKFEKVLDLKVTKELNNHVKLYLRGITKEENLDKYVENAKENEPIAVSLRGDEETETLFKGVVKNISIKATGNVRTLQVEAISATSLMDINLKKRSFKDKTATYESIFSKISKDYSGAQIIDEVTKGAKTKRLYVQYNETDWEYIKRLASYFNAPLVPNSKLNKVKFHVGIPGGFKSYTLKHNEYTVRKELGTYKYLSENHIDGINEQDHINYEVKSHTVLDLCNKVNIKSRTYYVAKAVIAMEQGTIVGRYTLRDLKGLKVEKIYNQELIGLSLAGNVLEIEKDKVKIKLDIDNGEDDPNTIWFPYSTVYSSPDGSGWYCMPEKEDKIRLYFPDRDEKNAKVANAAHLESEDSNERKDPDIKKIKTKYGKQIVFKKGAIEIIANDKLLMRLTDEGGIEILSDKKIVLKAEDDIELSSENKVLIEGDESINLKQGDANIDIKEDVIIGGAKVNME
ncbi:contractile injection system protein, VgrG/Pvc8 family [Dethiothermospora halolimnae]|uniref:contractile injection system protein, VgrG/Pvc8 family n=1 Tax=Dethiothermospora halolimnae TaxID=3114390 RepID=UPI003CCC01DC